MLANLLKSLTNAKYTTHFLISVKIFQYFSTKSTGIYATYFSCNVRTNKKTSLQKFYFRRQVPQANSRQHFFVYVSYSFKGNKISF